MGQVMPSALPKLDLSSLLTRSLPFVRDDAAYKVRVGGFQVSHQLVQILLWVDERGESETTGTILLVPESWAPDSLSPIPSKGQGADT